MTENTEVQRHIDALANGGSKAAAVTARSATALPTDAGSAAVARVLSDQLARTREGIGTFTRSIDEATLAMNKLWEQIQRDQDTLADLKRGEAMLAAAIHEGNRPKFQRG